MKYAVATRVWPDSVYTLPINDIWNVPISGSEVRGEITARGPWQTITSYRALVIADHEKDTKYYGDYTKSIRVYGIRTLTKAQESGYDLEGRVSMEGRKVRGFTTSVMFKRDDGSLVNVAAIYACL